MERRAPRRHGDGAVSRRVSGAGRAGDPARAGMSTQPMTVEAVVHLALTPGHVACCNRKERKQERMARTQRVSGPMAYLLDHYPKVAANAGPRKFLGWMLPQSLPGAPPEAGADGRGCMVLYAPKELFPDAPTLGELRYGRNGDHRTLSRANDLIVDGANKDGVKLDRAKFDPHAWAVIPDFNWPILENQRRTTRRR